MKSLAEVLNGVGQSYRGTWRAPTALMSARIAVLRTGAVCPARFSLCKLRRPGHPGTSRAAERSRVVRLLLAFVVLVVACGGAVGSPGPSLSLPPEARGALEQVYVDGNSYRLQVDLYRDLMPGPAPTPKRGVGGTIFLRPDIESAPPQGMRSEKAWLVTGAEVWETIPQPLQTFAADRKNHLSLSVRDGPTWDAGAKVDLILQFSTSSGTYFIQQRGVQVIGGL